MTGHWIDRALRGWPAVYGSVGWATIEKEKKK